MATQTNIAKYSKATSELIGTTTIAPKKIKLIIMILSILSILGIVGIVLKILNGFEDKSAWGYYAATISFLLTTAAAAPMVAIAPTIAKADWVRPITRIASLFSVVGIVTALASIPLIFALPPLIVDETRRRSIWFEATNYSPHVWFALSIFGLTLCGLGLLYSSSIPDLAAMRDHGTGWRKKMGKSLSRGFIGTDGQWKSLKMRIGMMGTFYFLMLMFVNFLFSIDFALSLVAGWKDAIFPMYHAMTSLQSGIAICILAMFFARKYWGMENYIKVPQFWALSKLQLATTVLWFYFFYSAFIVFWYGRSASDQMVINLLIIGPYLPVFLGAFFLEFFVPWWILVWNPVRKNIPALAVVACLVLVGVLLDRIRIFVISWSTYSNEVIHKKFVPEENFPQFMAPSVADIIVFIGLVSLSALIFILSTRIFPLVSVWETHQSLLLTKVVKYVRTHVIAIGKPD